MRIIAFGDIHMATAKSREIPGISEADLILLTGDLTNYGAAPEAKIYNSGMLRQGGWITINLSQSKLEVSLQ